MIITQNNYREWLNALEMGELTPLEEEALMLFMEANPQLIDASIDDEFPRLEPNAIVFDNKNLLLKSETGFDGMKSFDFLAVKSVEEGLNDVERVELNRYVASNPQYHRDYILYKATRLKADLSLIYPDQQSLKHSLWFHSGWWQGTKYAAAAAIIAGMTWFLWPDETLVQHNSVAEVIQPKSVKNDLLPVTAKLPETENKIHQSAKKTVPIVTPVQIDSVKTQMSHETVAYLTPKDANDVIIAAPIDGSQLLASTIPVDPSVDFLPQSNIEYALKDIDEEQLHRSDRISLRLLERGVMLVNFLGVTDVKFNKYYDNNGNVMAYQLIGDGFQWDQKVK